MRDALLDLMLGSRCAVCDRPGPALCDACRAALPEVARTRWPSPPPAGLARPTAVGDYDGPLKLLVNAHKEQHRFALARPLGELLAVSALVHVEESLAQAGGVRLVPVPSRRAVVRARGHDPLLRMARVAAGALRGRGVPAGVARALRVVRPVEDQAGLGAAARARNLSGTMAATRGAGRAVGGRGTRLLVLVVDDVITTGATVREAQRALEAAGYAVHGVAAVAATRRRREVVQSTRVPFATPADKSGTSLPFWRSED